MTLPLRKVALAPDRDDPEDAGTGTIGGSDVDTVSVAAPVAEAGDADMEGTIAEEPKPVEGLATQDPDPAWDAATSATPDDPAEADAAPPEETAAPTEEVTLSADEPEAGEPEAGEPEAGEPGAGEVGAGEVGAGDEAVPEPPSPPKSRRTAIAVLTVLSLAVACVAVGGFLWSRSSGDPATPPPQATSPSPTLSDGAFVTFNDPETGTSIRYPRGWRQSQVPNREVRLLVSDGAHYSALVRVTRNQDVATPSNLANFKAVTDGIVGPGAQILKQDPITVNGLIGYRYIYTTPFGNSGLLSAHVHYFLFQGHKMNSIVFEAVPDTSFDRIQGTFDQMLESFRSDPESP